MNSEQLAALIATLSGHLQAENAEEEQTISTLHQTIATAMLQQDANTVQNRQFSFETSDIFSASKIDSNRRTKIEEIANNAALKKISSEEFRIFIRDVPVRTTQVAGSVPDWAAGAKVDKTIGPIKRVDGRQIFVDIFKIVKLVALYTQGQTFPSILFSAHLPIRIAQVSPPEITKEYKVVAGTVWIRANILSAAAPADRYCGLKVSGGSIILDAVPQYQGEKLVIATNNNVQVSLNLVQQTVTDIDNSGPHGIDARNATYTLPVKFAFNYLGANKTIKEVGAASWKIYGQAANFTYGGSQVSLYDVSLSKVLIPMAFSLPEFNASSSQSPLCTISSSAKVQQAFWGLAAATLNVSSPLEAEGSGALIIKCLKGLRANWKGLDGNDALLSAPTIIGEPGRIGITDVASKGLGATQQIDLWKDEDNKHGTSLDISYLSAAPFIYNTVSKGDEIIVTLADTKVNIDRPVKVNGEPVAVRSKSSLVMFGANNKHKAIYLYDDNILWDNKLPADKAPVIKPIALALENALFTVSPVNGCILFGFCDTGFKKVIKANMYLSFGLFSYLPTLPDPYIANIGLLRRQLAGRVTNTQTAGAMWLWLVCRIQYKNVGSNDEVKVSFHFGNMPPDTPETSITTTATATSGQRPTIGTAATSIPVSGGRVSETIASNQTLKRTTAVSSAVIEFKNIRATEMLVAENIQAAKLAQVKQGNFVEGISDSVNFKAMAVNVPNYEDQWNDRYGHVNNDAFALLDVSSNANQMGISFGTFSIGRMAMLRTGEAVNDANDNSNFPFQVQEMHVVARGAYVRAFTMPQVAWEPVFNLTPPVLAQDPPAFMNYYPNDGGPTRLLNNSSSYVPLAPIPVVNFLLEEFKSNPTNITLASFTLPFGLKAIAKITKTGKESIKPKLEKKAPTFKTDPEEQLVGGIQIMAWAGNYDIKGGLPANEKDSRMFPGYIIQLNNVLGLNGNPTAASTLGQRVTEIFNGEFFSEPISKGDPPEGRGVPVTRIDFTGYGANMFSNWLSPSAEFAATSQARFDVMMGRTAHEVIQVKSILYPWGIRVVRTITLYRVSSGYVYRVDSGWKAESDGKFDFRYKYVKLNETNRTEVTPYQIHPGVVKGLYNVQNIKDAPDVAEFVTKQIIPKDAIYLNGLTGKETKNQTGKDIEEEVKCGAVWFDADVEIENVVQGHTNGRIPSKKILGYVQLAPSGKPLTQEQFRELLRLQGDSIGGPVDCLVDINNSKQQMRINRYDVNASVDAASNIAFVVAARGNVVLPKDGSWSMVTHAVGTGEVTPLPEAVTVPLVRAGKWWTKDQVVNPADINTKLIQLSHPIDLLRAVNNDTINFGFLQSTSTQKALFLTPSYAKGADILLSKTPPIFADAYRLMSGKGIFPNIGNAVDNFGKAMPLATAKGAAAFKERVMADGTKVLELMQVLANKAGDAPIAIGEVAVKQGMNMLQVGANGVLNKAIQFDVPSFEVPLVEMDGLKIYIDYKTGKEKSAGTFVDSKLNFDVQSFTNTLADQWKSRMNNLSMVVDLGSIKRLMIIKGNFDAKKGKESGYEGGSSPLEGLPVPEIEFNEALQPVIDLLQMLADLSSGNYAETLKRGMKIAMSNSGEVWEYKFEATKDIPLVRFPPTDELYNNPNCPLKLEASMGIGVYFNAALKVTTDPKQLLPTAGAFLQFHGGLSVMCFSVSVGTIYATGAVDVKIACDTKIGPSLFMKFGFGAQIVVGLPVVGNVSVLYMVGVEIYAGTDKITLAAFMLFRGHAELLGGLVGVTITIEAKGIVERIGDETNCSASVTFALDISIFLVIDISFSETWGESRQIA